MPTYDYHCEVCGLETELRVPMAERDNQHCGRHAEPVLLTRKVSAPLFKFMGRVTKGGGPDKFTADILGIPLKELPSGLRTEPGSKA